MYPSQTKRSKCGICFKEMLDDNLREHCKKVHNKPKNVYVKGQRTFDFTPVSEPGRNRAEVMKVKLAQASRMLNIRQKQLLWTT